MTLARATGRSRRSRGRSTRSRVIRRGGRPRVADSALLARVVVRRAVSGPSLAGTPAAQRAHAQGADLLADGSDDRRADHVAAGDARRRAQLGLPLRWIRDSTFGLWGLYTLGFDAEANDFFYFVADAAESEADLQVMYAIDGDRELPERALDHLSGYEGARPVRAGNDAYRQRQHDIWGALLDSVYLHVRSREHLPERVWPTLRRQVECALGAWREPDRGIWEVRGQPKHFTSSKLFCWVAADRGARLASLHGELELAVHWHAAADEIHADICAHGVDDRGVFVQHYGTTALDASLLLMPLVRFLPPGDPRIRATVLAIADELTVDGLVLRYRVDETDDGLSGEEGSFTICSFWLVSALVEIGEVDRARKLCGKLLALGSPLQLYAEELDPATGRHLGNFPQAFTHLALINAVMHVVRATRRGGRSRVTRRRLRVPSMAARTSTGARRRRRDVRAGRRGRPAAVPADRRPRVPFRPRGRRAAGTERQPRMAVPAGARLSERLRHAARPWRRPFSRRPPGSTCPPGSDTSWQHGRRNDLDDRDGFLMVRDALVLTPWRHADDRRAAAAAGRHAGRARAAAHARVRPRSGRGGRGMRADVRLWRTACAVDPRRCRLPPCHRPRRGAFAGLAPRNESPPRVRRRPRRASTTLRESERAFRRTLLERRRGAVERRRGVRCGGRDLQALAALARRRCVPRPSLARAPPAQRADTQGAHPRPDRRGRGRADHLTAARARRPPQLGFPVLVRPRLRLGGPRAARARIRVGGGRLRRIPGRDDLDGPAAAELLSGERR